MGNLCLRVRAIQGLQTSLKLISSSVARFYEEQLYMRDLFEFLEFEDDRVKPYQEIEHLS